MPTNPTDPPGSVPENEPLERTDAPGAHERVQPTRRPPRLVDDRPVTIVPPPPVRAWSDRLPAFLFSALLAINLWGVSVGWQNGNLPGCEFRQAQTALSAQFIQREDNFSLAYPAPVLGKPWSIPMEFPLYQWTVVALSNASGLDLTVAGRLVSALCFYLMLPGLYLLFGRLRLAAPARFLVLGLVLTCPLYIFYARAFLIETMALMFGVWYLAALVEAGDRRRRHSGWAALALLAGTAAGLVKVTTFIVFLLPALAWACAWLWRARPQPEVPGWGRFGRTLAWLAAVHAVPFAAATWWVRHADAIKLQNPMGAMLASRSLADFNFGHAVRFDPATWMQHGAIVLREVANPVLLALAGLLAVLAAAHWRRLAAGALAVFLAVLAIFPGLYAWHEYYHVAAAFLLLAAAGFALAGGWQSPRLSRRIGIVILLAVHATQLGAYFIHHYPMQSARSTGVSGLALALRQLTAPDDVVVIAGDDWSSITPHFAQRRALMLRHGTERDRDLVTRAFAQLEGERVTALLLKGAERDNPLLVDLAVEHFDIDPLPALTWQDTTVYFHHQLRNEVVRRHLPDSYHDVRLAPESARPTTLLAGRVRRYANVWPEHRPLFRTIEPKPERFLCSTGPSLWESPDRAPRFSAHPDTRLWFQLAPGPHRIRTSLELAEGAYAGLPREEATDGVELIALVRHPDGRREEIGRRRLNPRDRPADRSPRLIDWSFRLETEAELEIAVTAGPAGDSGRDWAWLGPLTIE